MREDFRTWIKPLRHIATGALLLGLAGCVVGPGDYGGSYAGSYGSYYGGSP